MILQIGGEILFTARRKPGAPVYATFEPTEEPEELEGLVIFRFPFPQPKAGSVIPTAIQVHVRKANETFPPLLDLVKELDRYGRTEVPKPDPITGLYASKLAVSVNVDQFVANSPDDVPSKAIAIAIYPD